MVNYFLHTRVVTNKSFINCFEACFISQVCVKYKNHINEVINQCSFIYPIGQIGNISLLLQLMWVFSKNEMGEDFFSQLLVQRQEAEQELNQRIQKLGSEKQVLLERVSSLSRTLSSMELEKREIERSTMRLEKDRSALMKTLDKVLLFSWIK